CLIFPSTHPATTAIYTLSLHDALPISHTLGTAANTQMMVFGNMGPDSGTGVAFTRNQVTGAKELYGEYLPNAQGEDVVAGIRTRSEEHTSELQSRFDLVCRLLLEKKKK